MFRARLCTLLRIIEEYNTLPPPSYTIPAHVSAIVLNEIPSIQPTWIRAPSSRQRAIMPPVTVDTDVVAGNNKGKQRLQAEQAKQLELLPIATEELSPRCVPSSCDGLEQAKLEEEEKRKSLQALADALINEHREMELNEAELNRQRSRSAYARAYLTTVQVKGKSRTQKLLDKIPALSDQPETFAGPAATSYNVGPALERGVGNTMAAIYGRPAGGGLRRAAVKFMAPKLRTRKRKKAPTGWLPRWRQDIIVKPRDCKGFWMDLLYYVPAIAYGLTAWIPLCTTLDDKVQLGLQIANGVLFVGLLAMGLFQGRFSEEK